MRINSIENYKYIVNNNESTIHVRSNDLNINYLSLAASIPQYADIV